MTDQYYCVKHTIKIKKVRERETEILFESFQVDSVYHSVSSILAMYMTGHTSGIIIKCGAG